MRYVVMAYKTSPLHPYMPSKELFGIFDIKKNRRLMGAYTKYARASQVASRKNSNEVQITVV